MNASPTRFQQKLDPKQRRSLLVRTVAMLMGMALLLFLPAGSFSWFRGWLFLATFLVLAVAAMAYLWRVNPEIFVARSRMFREGTKRWDRILLAFLMPSMIAIVPVAALDGGRFHWSRMPGWVVAAGYVLLVAGMMLVIRAQAVNPFFEPSVRIQSERGHRVVESGPYAIVRHPGYAAAIPLFTGMALCLGSSWCRPRLPQSCWCCGLRGKTARCRRNWPVMRVTRRGSATD